MPKFDIKICDSCGVEFRDDHYRFMPELCTPCWYIPEHIPEDQHVRFYKLRKTEKSQEKKRREYERQVYGLPLRKGTGM